MQDIDRVLEQKREQARELQAEIDALKRARDILGEEAPPRRVRKKVKRRGGRKAAKKRTQKAKGQLSIPDAAEKVLKENGKPLHAREIAERIKKLGAEATPHNVATCLQRYVYRRKRFKKTAPGTFALA